MNQLNRWLSDAVVALPRFSEVHAQWGARAGMYSEDGVQVGTINAFLVF